MTAGIELRSDTFTLPSDAMYVELGRARLGDDVYGEDPTVARLERRAATLTGQDAALLVTSGTQANLVALIAQTRPGQEIIVGRLSDLHNYETGGVAMVAGLQTRTVDDSAGLPHADAVEGAIRSGDVHHGDTGLLALENSHAAAGGRVASPAAMREVIEPARACGIPVHLDGARLFNAGLAAGVPAAEIGVLANSVSFSLSKGLGAPVGAMLCSTTEVIAKARWARKLLGGGMRQAGWIASAGLVALDRRDRLAVDHENARALAEGLARLPGVDLAPTEVQTNIVYLRISADCPVTAPLLVERLAERGVRTWNHRDRVRMVTHCGFERADVARVTAAVDCALSEPIVEPPGRAGRRVFTPLS